MAHFIGIVQGNRKSVSRLGSKESGIDAVAQGWNIGGRIICKHDLNSNSDIVAFFINGGSNNSTTAHVATFTLKNDKITPIYLNEELLSSFYLKVLRNAPDDPVESSGENNN